MATKIDEGIRTLAYHLRNELTPDEEATYNTAKLDDTPMTRVEAVLYLDKLAAALTLGMAADRRWVDERHK